MPPVGDDLPVWLREARAGSAEALGLLFKRCRGYLYLIARAELDPAIRAKGSASDLVQETFLEAQLAFPRFAGKTEDELKAWLRQLLLNNVADFTRRFRDTAKRRLSSEVSLDAGSSSFDRDAGFIADLPLPEEVAVRREEADAVLRALDRLPEDQRRVLLLRHREDRTFPEIGTLMGRSANAAEKLWARAIERLQRELEESA
jgi:RNA polymerase sigma-70 factor (ECF subfamily)